MSSDTRRITWPESTMKRKPSARPCSGSTRWPNGWERLPRRPAHWPSAMALRSTPKCPAATAAATASRAAQWIWHQTTNSGRSPRSTWTDCDGDHSRAHMRANDGTHLADRDSHGTARRLLDTASEGKRAISVGQVLNGDVSGTVTDSLNSELFKPAERPGCGAHLLERHHRPIDEMEQRLDRQRRTDECCGLADAATAAQVLKGVDVE